MQTCAHTIGSRVTVGNSQVYALRYTLDNGKCTRAHTIRLFRCCTMDIKISHMYTLLATSVKTSQHLAVLHTTEWSVHAQPQDVSASRKQANTKTAMCSTRTTLAP